jgi:hypothetical protein
MCVYYNVYVCMYKYVCVYLYVMTTCIYCTEYTRCVCVVCVRACIVAQLPQSNMPPV